MGEAQRKRVAVVADDITGANDIGLMFAKNGLSTGVIPFDEQTEVADFGDLDVVVLDTDSRLDPPAVAAGKVIRATKLLQQASFDLYFNKTCSVFRGNIGAAFDAMQDALGGGCAMVVLGFPKLGRTTLNGIHYLNGVRLDLSAFVNDPIHPTTEANLQRILAKQSGRPSGVFTAQMLDLPQDERQAALADLQGRVAYVIFDVRHQGDLRTIAALIADARNICGSSAIGEELPRVWGRQAAVKRTAPPAFDQDGRGTLIVAGSLTVATKQQVAYLKAQGCPAAELDPDALMESRGRGHVAHIVSLAATAIREGRDFLVHTASEPHAVAESKRKARQQGMDDAQLGKLVSHAIGEIVSGVLAQTGAHKVVVAGGDTSMAVSGALGIRKMAIFEEIEPGVPAMLGQSPGKCYAIVFKSGSFGSEAFLQKASVALNHNLSGS